MMGLGAQGDGWVINRGEEGYPRMLEDLSDPPARIYGRGRLSALVEPCFAIVGTRRITPYGAALCELAAKLAVESGLTVVSGGAIGCDQVAGRAALDAGGMHIVVLGTGADVVYPARSGPLIELALARGGAVISLEPWGMGPAAVCVPQTQSGHRGALTGRLRCRGGHAFGYFLHGGGCRRHRARAPRGSGFGVLGGIARDQLSHRGRGDDHPR